MTKAELFSKIIDLMKAKVTGIIKIKLHKGNIVWAKRERDI